MPGLLELLMSWPPGYRKFQPALYVRSVAWVRRIQLWPPTRVDSSMTMVAGPGDRCLMNVPTEPVLISAGSRRFLQRKRADNKLFSNRIALEV